ncbi:MAG: lysophospholipid acyltransferase family protein [Parvibaculum sp.]
MLTFRSILFNFLFYTTSVIAGLLGLPLLLGPQNYAIRFMRAVGLWNLWLLKIIAGTKYEVRGLENLGTSPVIVASKHQSMWETVSLLAIVDNPALILKQELLYIPLYGQYVKKAGMIPIRRSDGPKALRTMLRQADEAVKSGRHLIIFPEGTRAAPGARNPYMPGVAGLYGHLDVPCVPVALNSGLFWPRRQLQRKPGTIVVEFLPPIPPGMNRKAFMSELENQIEGATGKLLAEAGFTPTA